MELIVLGAAPAYTDRRGSASSSYLLRTGVAAARGSGEAGGSGIGSPRTESGATLLLDLGQGAFANLAAEIEPSTLTAVLVSHLHPDHFIDLVPLRHYLKWEFDPSRRVRVLGPAGLVDRLDALSGEPGFSSAALDVEGLQEGTHRFGPFEVEVRRVAHTNESYAFRASIAASSAPGLVYSGDCSRVSDLIPLVRQGDTLLSEASFGAGPIAPGAQHITSGDAARVAAEGGAVRLLLTHILSGHSRPNAIAAAQAVFSGITRMVTEGDRFEV